jgi:COMM domain containing 5
MKWRLDVAISTTALKRVMQPSVTIQLPLSDGSVHTFEMSVAEFHKLRFNVARVMKDMLDLEKAPILRID